MKKQMMNRPQKFNVLRNWNGCSGVLVEVIERIPRRHSGRTRKQDRPSHPYKTVSYKGKTYKVFSLPECYGELAGRCICIERSE